nr:non-structural protein NS4a [Apoi virus]
SGMTILQLLYEGLQHDLDVVYTYMRANKESRAWKMANEDLPEALVGLGQSVLSIVGVIFLVWLLLRQSKVDRVTLGALLLTAGSAVLWMGGAAPCVVGGSLICGFVLLVALSPEEGMQR